MKQTSEMIQTKDNVSMNTLPTDIIGYIVEILMNDCYNTMKYRRI